MMIRSIVFLIIYVIITEAGKKSPSYKFCHEIANLGPMPATTAKCMPFVNFAGPVYELEDGVNLRHYDRFDEDTLIRVHSTFGPFVKVGHGVQFGRRMCVEGGIKILDGTQFDEFACLELLTEDGKYGFKQLAKDYRCYFVDNKCVVAKQEPVYKFRTSMEFASQGLDFCDGLHGVKGDNISVEAYCAPSVAMFGVKSVGKESKFRDNAVVRADAEIGRYCSFGPRVVINKRVTFKDRACVDADVIVPADTHFDERACLKLKGKAEDGKYEVIPLKDHQRCYFVKDQCVVKTMKPKP